MPLFFIPSFFLSLSRWAFVGLGVAIPLSTALDNILLFILFSVLFTHMPAVWRTMTQNAVARAGVVLFAALLLGMSYGVTPLKEAAGMLGKYADLAFVPLLMIVARDAKTRRQAEQAFLAAMLVTALLSWLVGLRILPVAEWMWRGCFPENPAIFRSSITQNILMVYAAYLLLLRVRETPVPKIKWLTIWLAALAGSNVLFMVQGKTGYLIMLALLTYFGWQSLMRYGQSPQKKIQMAGRCRSCTHGMCAGARNLSIFAPLASARGGNGDGISGMATE